MKPKTPDRCRVCISTLLAAIAGTVDILRAIALRNLEQREREKNIIIGGAKRRCRLPPAAPWLLALTANGAGKS